MSAAPRLPNLHDATLIGVEINWSAGTATIELERIPQAFLKMVARGLHEFTMTRREVWGRSVSINAVDVDTNDAGECSVVIEMQSGDNIRLVADQLDVAEL